MKTWLVNLWDGLRTSFWLVPGLMAVGGLILAVALLLIDAFTQVGTAERLSWLNAGTAESVSTLLSVIIGAIITVLSVVFSITIVALTLAVSQLGPRLLRNFMRDTFNQFALGVFVATFIYSLACLHAVGRFRTSMRVPHLAVLGAFVMTLFSAVVLVFFIHHVARSIQPSHVIHAVAGELEASIRRWFPAEAEAAVSRQEPVQASQSAVCVVPAPVDGYMQAVDMDGLVDLAQSHDLVVHVNWRPGDFVMATTPLLRAVGRESLDEETQEAITATFFFGPRRTATEDYEFIMLELVEMAVRALSPGINDPFTAISCVDQLSAALGHMCRRQMPRTHFHDGDGRLRLVLRQTDFDGLADAAFNQIRQQAERTPGVLIRMLEDIALIARHTCSEEQSRTLARHAAMVMRAGMRLPEKGDRDDIAKRYEAVVALAGLPDEGPAA